MNHVFYFAKNNIGLQLLYSGCVLWFCRLCWWFGLNTKSLAFDANLGVGRMSMSSDGMYVSSHGMYVSSDGMYVSSAVC